MVQHKPGHHRWEITAEEIWDVINTSDSEQLIDDALQLARVAQRKLKQWEDQKCTEHPIRFGEHFMDFHPRRGDCLECQRALRQWLGLKPLTREDIDEFARRRLPRLPRVRKGHLQEK